MDQAYLANIKPSHLLESLVGNAASMREEMKANERNIDLAIEFLETLTHTSKMMRNLMMDLLDLA